MKGYWLKCFLLSASLFSGLLVAEESPAKGEKRFLEGYNKAMFAINDGLDVALFKPLAKGYHTVMPDPAERGVRNFFSNLGEIRNILNDLLQGKGGQAVNDTGRFVVNTTLGVAGFFDVASLMGLDKPEGEDFGQTLGKWGVGSGSYLVLPLLGPSSLRDAPGRVVDAFTNPVGYVDHVPTRNSLYGTDALSTRAELLEAEELLGGDKYQLVKDAYMQRREYLVTDGAVEDDFGSYEDY